MGRRECMYCGGSTEHLPPRTRRCEACKVQKDAEYKARYAAAHVEKERARCRAKANAVYQADPVGGAAKARARRLVDPEAARRRERAWYAANVTRERARGLQKARARMAVPEIREKANARRKAARETNLDDARKVARDRARAAYAKCPDKRIECNRRRRARAANAPGPGVTATEWRAVLDYFGNRCAYCNRGDCKLTMDHVEPLASGGAHEPQNVVPACGPCNQSKKDRRLWSMLPKRAA